jgi:hypothetical protein
VVVWSLDCLFGGHFDKYRFKFGCSIHEKSLFNCLEIFAR